MMEMVKKKAPKIEMEIRNSDGCPIQEIIPKKDHGVSMFFLWP